MAIRLYSAEFAAIRKITKILAKLTPSARLMVVAFVVRAAQEAEEKDAL